MPPMYRRALPAWLLIAAAAAPAAAQRAPRPGPRGGRLRVVDHPSAARDQAEAPPG